MNFEKFFRSISYAAVFCGFLSLWVTGSFGIVESLLFSGVFVAGWFLEGSRWQISERVGTGLIVIALPAAYLAYKFKFYSVSGLEVVLPGILARMILSLSAIKILQRKSDRDWVFLYMMSFFEVLLAAGLSISLLYLTSFLVYLLVMVCAVIAYEMRKTAGEVDSRIHPAGDGSQIKDRTGIGSLTPSRLPTAAIVLIAFTTVLALPLFFLLPRVGGAGLGGMQNPLSSSTGFSESIKLGGTGRLEQNDTIVMHVKIEGAPSAVPDLYFRGVANDKFDNIKWSRSKDGQKDPVVAGDHDLIQIDFASGKDDLLIQTIYLEPLATSVLFAVPRTIAVQGNFNTLFKDRYGAIYFQPNGERTSYKVLSDTSPPPVSELREDNQAYGIESKDYLQLPDQHDGRIDELASKVAGGFKNKYDKAAAIESYLRNNYGYSLEMRAGGPEPVADFLFNVKEGHCEYFASAMALMLRSQGVATRVVNGFHGGEYNETAGMYFVRQRHAHAWVEVYFPKKNVWVKFDPTPNGGDGGASTSGMFSFAGRYIDALDAFWIQYFVAFDNQGQRTLARSVRSSLVDYQAKTSGYLSRMQDAMSEWWSSISGEKGTAAAISAYGAAAAVAAGIVTALLLIIWVYRRLDLRKMWRRLRDRLWYRPEGSAVDFYDRMQRILAEKGIFRPSHQTPLEFAGTLGFPEAVLLTERYNRVRFGEHSIAAAESAEIRTWLSNLSKAEISICRETDDT